MRLSRVAICCDFLMTRPITQRYHLRWFQTIVQRALLQASDVNIFSFVSDENGAISRVAFFELSKIELNTSETHFHFEPSAISRESIELVSRALKGCLVVGYELSEETRTILTLAQVNYIDVWLHPIRFMDDNFFAYHSNSAEIDGGLRRYHLTDDVFYLYADKLKIQSYMGWDRYDSNLDKYLVPNSALFVGQTLTDKAVCRNGTMLNILNFKEEFAQLSKDHEHVYFSRHPLLVGSDDDQIHFVTSFANASLIDEPGYKLLTSDAIATVCAVSSSMVYESKFFGKKPHYFYRPVVPIMAPGSSGGYVSIFGKLHSPSFWRDVLSDLVPVKHDAPEYDFLKRHSNYRDMLALYYNTDVFDKEHAVYKRSVDWPREASSRVRETKDVPNGFELNVLNFDRVKGLIDQHSVASFDIFDTLLQRHLHVAGDVVKLVAKKATDRFGIDEEMFIKARREAKLQSSKREVPLEERYAILGRLLGIDQSISEALFIAELDLERALLTERPVGKMLFRYAKSKGKRVVVTSDTYFDQAFIAELLAREGIVPDAFYLSRDFNATKEDGSLFSALIDAEGADIVQIGDNRKADYTNAISAGIAAAWLISNRDQIKRSLPRLTLVPATNGHIATIQNGLAINSMAVYPAITRDAGYTQNSPRNLGFNVFGDMMLAFASWIISRAKADGFTNLYFLARDGEIVKKVVDLVLSASKDTSIKTHYLLASRRCVRVIALRSAQDVQREAQLVLSELTKNKRQAALSQYLSLRFGLSEDRLREMRLPAINDEGDYARLAVFMASSSFEFAVLNNAEEERRLYNQYLDSLGFPVGGRFAVIDIGHHGSLQASLALIRHANSSTGYYFATYSKVDETLGMVPGEHYSAGFYRDRASADARDDSYIRYALMIEALFLNDTGTFLRFQEAEEQLVPQFLEGDSEERFEFNRAVHSGTLEYVGKILKIVNACFGAIDLRYFSSQEDVCARYFDLLKSGYLRDAQTFSAITFENFFSGRQMRYLVPPASVAASHEGIWREGSAVLAKRDSLTKVEPSQPKSVPMRARLVLSVFYPLLNPHLSIKERHNYRSDPQMLFSKSKHPVMRFVGAAAGLRKYRRA